MPQAFLMTSPREAAHHLLQEEARRLREVRQIVVSSVNNLPVWVDHLVDGGPLLHANGIPRALNLVPVLYSFYGHREPPEEGTWPVDRWPGWPPTYQLLRRQDHGANAAA
jgi:hypothetical protein